MNIRDLSQPSLDLSACAREPIHIPGSIQPHGFLVALDPDQRIVHASDNLASALGLSVEHVIGRAFPDVWPELDAQIAGDLERTDLQSGATYLRTAALGTGSFDVAAHRCGPLLIIEMEGVDQDRNVSLDALYPTLRGFVERLQGANSIDELLASAAEAVRRLTGFDRVLIYRFDANWHGTVVAEDRNDVLPSYLDLRFPASDIPAQARELYRRNRLRIIPNCDYAPVPITPAASLSASDPLDLSQSILRSVSPVHLEYMRNMGTASSMSISVLRQGDLWGLISCHSKGPRTVPLQTRNACDFIGQIFALQLSARQQAEEAGQRAQLAAARERLLTHMAGERSFAEGLVNHPDDLMRIAEATGAAVISGEHCWLMGSAPAEEQVRQIFEWLAAHHREDVFATDALGQVLPEASAYAEKASGLLAISISKMHASYILWFRPEVVQTVRWGGNPEKPVSQEPGGPGRINPRKSFETWKETVQGRSVPWSQAEIDAVKELRSAVVGIVLRRAEEMAALSEELQRSNKELEAFSYSVSHDLRAPFRHVVGYAELLRSKGGELNEKGRRYLETIIESATSAGTLVDNLLGFSQMGRTTLKRAEVDMNALVASVRQAASREAGHRRITWRLGELMPVHADPAMLRALVENLISNAVKYTRPREEAVIEVGSRQGSGEVVYWVRDNGVGFDMAYVDKLFGVFQRLHGVDEFEGTGIGLANVRRIAERHGGRVWAEAELDRGATLFFAIPQDGAE